MFVMDQGRGKAKVQDKIMKKCLFGCLGFYNKNKKRTREKGSEGERWTRWLPSWRRVRSENKDSGWFTFVAGI